MNIINFMKKFNYLTESGIRNGNTLYDLETECVNLGINNINRVDMSMLRTNLIEPAMLYSDYSGPSITDYFDKKMVNMRQINDDNTNIKKL